MWSRRDRGRRHTWRATEQPPSPRPTRQRGLKFASLLLLGVLAACAVPSGADRPEPPVRQVSWVHKAALPHPPITAEPVPGEVTSIIDGDTITVAALRQTVTVRLLGIDTPEKPGGPRPAECFGTEASAFLQTLIPVGSSIRLSRDVETRDQYGRLLAWVHRDDGVFVNLAMVESGHASVLFFAPNDGLETQFEQAGFAARRDGRGFWAACGGPDVTIES